MENSRSFSNYLAGITQASKAQPRPHVVVREHQLGKEAASRLNHSVFDLLQAKSAEFQASWTQYNNERSSNIGEDVLVAGASFCIAVRVSMPTAAIDPNSLSTIGKAENEAWQKIMGSLSRSKGQHESRAAVLASKVLRLRDPSGSLQAVLEKQLLPMMQALRDRIRQGMEAQDDEEVADVDMMDSMESRTSQGTQPGSYTTATEAIRRELKESAMPDDSPVCCLLDLSVQSARGIATGILGSEQLSTLVDDFVRLDSGSLLTVRQTLYDLFEVGPSFGRADAARLLKHLAEACLQDDEFERSEAAMCCCAKIMTKLAHMWTSDIDDNLTEWAFDIYSWFIGTALGKGIASPQALFDISLLLDTVSTLAPSYGSSEDLPSPRTSLLKVLLEGQSGLKYRLSTCLAHMFDRYILVEHGAIFNDIVAALPNDLNDLEGIAVRFHVLADLGSRWHTVRRQATYHLFETATNVPKLTGLGRDCLHRMSLALKLASAKQLFRAFASQIFYIWLGQGLIRQIPFDVFDYESLTDLVRENASELVAQIALRGSKEHAEELSDLLGTSWSMLLEKYFAHAEGYCLASQTSLPSREQLYINSESLIRTDLSTDVYSNSMRQQLPSILATLFKALQDDYGIERAFEKSGLTEPLSVMRKVCGLSASTSPLPSGQQPSFRAKFIIEEINWLCKRTDFDFQTMWSPPLLVHIYRQLLQSANAVLGPLHAASVVRKIRAVVCLGGTNAVKGYPLEMILHNLRPFLTVFQCSEDTIGLYWYLLEAGKEHLLSHLSFLAGLSVSIFASLTTFIASSQDSTTQGSQFLSTMSKAKDFRKWLGRFLSIAAPDEDDEQKVERFRQLVQHAKSMTAGGSSSKNTPEGNVLLGLLMDRMMKDPLLNEMHFYLSVSILCKDFSPTTDPSDDILTGQTNFASFTTVLREILTRISLPDTFRTWAAYVIGRGYSAAGPAELRAQSDSSSKVSAGFGIALSTSESYSAIVRSLEDLVWQEDVSAAAEAEHCLQAIATSLDRSTALAVLGKGHDQRLLAELGFEDFPCPESLQVTSDTHPSLTLEHWQTPTIPDAWAPTLVVALCNHLSNDPVLGSLRMFAASVPAAARRLLPYVVHLVLAAELNEAQPAKVKISEIFSSILEEISSRARQVVKPLLQSILYLRHCVLPTEATKAQRNYWLDVDFSEAAAAAVALKMWHEALLFIELQQSQLHLLSGRSTRRSTQTGTNNIPDFTAVVFENVDDPDFFYAGHEDTDLSSVIQRLEHESSGFKTLSFQSAVFDASIRSQEGKNDLSHVALSTARALNAANLRAISQAVTAFAHGQSHSALDREASDLFFDLHDWNVRPGIDSTQEASNTLRSLRTLSSATSAETMVQALNAGLLESVNTLPLVEGPSERYGRCVRSIAILAEARYALVLKGYEDFDNLLKLEAAVDLWSQNEE